VVGAQSTMTTVTPSVYFTHQRLITPTKKSSHTYRWTRVLRLLGVLWTGIQLGWQDAMLSLPGHLYTAPDHMQYSQKHAYTYVCMHVYMHVSRLTRNVYHDWQNTRYYNVY